MWGGQASGYGGFAEWSQAEGAREPDAESCVKACDPVVGHDAQATPKGLGLSRWERLPDIEDAKEDETEQQIFPAKGRLVGDEAERRRRPGICCSPPYR